MVLTTATLRLAHIPDQEVPGWKRYRVMLDGEPVGFVVEHRPWRGSGYGGQRWIAAHNPSGGDWTADWASAPVRTRRWRRRPGRAPGGVHLGAVGRSGDRARF